MKKYVVGVFSHHEGNNLLFMVDANDPIEALKKAIIERMPARYRTKDFYDWVEGLGTDFDSVLTGAAQSELILTEPYCIFS